MRKTKRELRGMVVVVGECEGEGEGEAGSVGETAFDGAGRPR